MRTVRIDILRLLVAFLVIVCGACGGDAIQAFRQGAGKPLVILYDNDVHCATEGYVALSRLREAISDTAWVAVTSSGDFLQGGVAGAVSRGQYIADIMSAVGYDAVTLGNHEFDYGIPRMKQLIRSAALPVTCVNLHDIEGDSTVYAPYIMKKYGDKRIAFVGVVTPSTLYSEAYAFYSDGDSLRYDLCDRNVYEKVQQAVDAARKEGADYVVVLSHLGEEATPQNDDSHGLVAATTGIDAVLDGHTHSVVECCKVRNGEGKMIPVTQTGTKCANIGKLHISVEGKVTAHLIPSTAFPPADEGVRDKVQQVVDSVKTMMSAVTERRIGYTPFPVEILDSMGRQRVRYAETNAGDIVTDALRAYTGADIAIVNGGDIRSGIVTGEITVGDVIEMLPYSNPVAVVEVTGKELQELLSVCCQEVPKASGDFPQVSGMRFSLGDGLKKEVSDLSVLDTLSGDYVPIDITKRYTLATIEYAITGGGLHGRLRNVPCMKDYDVTDTDVVIWFLEEVLHGTLPLRYATVQGRINNKSVIY